jgi:hypothetical protein
MRDELYDRDYQAGRAELHAGVDRFLAKIGDELAIVFAALHRIEWRAPWKTNDASRAAHAPRAGKLLP